MSILFFQQSELHTLYFFISNFTLVYLFVIDFKIYLISPNSITCTITYINVELDYNVLNIIILIFFQSQIY